MLDGQPAAAAIAPDGANAAQHGGRPAHRGAAGLHAPAPNVVPPPEDTAYMVDLHRQVFNAKLQEHMASKAKSMTLLFESEYAQALECLGIYGTLDVGSEERKKAAPTARKFEILTCGGDQELVKYWSRGHCTRPHLGRDLARANQQRKQYGRRWRRLRRRMSIRTSRQTSDETRCKQRRPPPSSGPQAPMRGVERQDRALRDAMAQLHPTPLYFICPAVDTWDGSSGDLSLGSLRLGDGNMEAGGVARKKGDY
eukprot:jgi/Tetstr1/445593/TSEL_003399.t1